MLITYVPILLAIIIAIVFALVSVGFSVLAGKVGRRTKAKDTAYECGKDPVGRGGARFSVKFYLVAMLFILFDIEVVFFYAWAVIYRQELQQDNLEVFWAMVPFVVLFFVGEYYAWKKGALDWVRSPGVTVTQNS
jgi:NADH-quinone oxidoreductase subunit A